MQAYLILANGKIFAGQSVGCPGTTVGEVVFATGMVGFEETLTDPSYYGQIITQTYPMIGNYGMNREDQESEQVWAKGYIVREACTAPSNFRCEETLDAFLKANGTIGIEGIDTRCLTRTLRESGVMNGAITTEFNPRTQPDRLAELMPVIAAYAVENAVKSVSCTAPAEYNPEGALHVALLDLGCKKNIVRCLVKRGCHVTVLPATTTPAQLAALNPDGLMLSNGPGDPAENTEIIQNIAKMLDTGITAFGICLGHQLTALAAGAKTCKLKYGHRGANQPVTEFATGRTYITSQNHGYAVEGETLPADTGRVSHANANDKTCEGIVYTRWNCYTVQFHPEASGGPRDTEFLFDRFVERMQQAKGGR
ncbi:MAG: carbamoyl phosphate synthase small subunit [Gemmiger sp.]|nr:carbamoyl phosphate synthase small subunit [Gemmiger sp.]